MTNRCKSCGAPIQVCAWSCEYCGQVNIQLSDIATWVYHAPSSPYTYNWSYATSDSPVWTYSIYGEYGT